jgi:hypothetical protein
MKSNSIILPKLKSSINNEKNNNIEDLLDKENYEEALNLIIKTDNYNYFNNIEIYCNKDFYNKLNLYTKCFEYKAYQCFKYLLDHNIYVRDNILLEACNLDNIELVKIIIINGYYKDYVKITNTMHLCYKECLIHENYALLDLIINNLYYKNIYKFSLLKMVIDYGNENLFNYLISKNKILINEINYFMSNFNYSNQVAIDIDDKLYIKNYIKNNIIK